MVEVFCVGDFKANGHVGGSSLSRQSDLTAIKCGWRISCLESTIPDMSSLRKFWPEKKQVGISNPGDFGLLHDIFEAEGFYHELEESDDVLWNLIASNQGGENIIVCHCKPWAAGPPWHIEHAWPVAGNTGGVLW